MMANPQRCRQQGCCMGSLEALKGHVYPAQECIPRPSTLARTPAEHHQNTLKVSHWPTWQSGHLSASGCLTSLRLIP